MIVGRWFFESGLFCQLVGKFVSRYVCMARNPLYCDRSLECMEVVGDIGECQGSGLSRAGFESIETLYGSLIVCEDPYVSFGEVITLTYLKACFCSFKNSK